MQQDKQETFARNWEKDAAKAAYFDTVSARLRSWYNSQQPDGEEKTNTKGCFSDEPSGDNPFLPTPKNLYTDRERRRHALILKTMPEGKHVTGKQIYRDNDGRGWTYNQIMSDLKKLKMHRLVNMETSETGGKTTWQIDT